MITALQQKVRMVALTVVGIAAMSLQSASAQCDSVNTELTNKFRFLGEWQSNGKPLYLEGNSDVVDQSLIEFVENTLPESVSLPKNTDRYFGDDIKLNTELTKDSKVFITFVHEGADWRNSLGFYTYDLNNPPATVYDIDSLTIIFPNVTEPGILKPGDKVYLGNFPANTGIGYFLIAKGYSKNTICLNSHIVFSEKRFNTYSDEQYMQHTIMLNYQQAGISLLSFEDLKRPDGDNDFNDAVFFITTDPQASDTSDIPVIASAKISGDTVLCSQDDLARITIETVGKAPFTVVYNNGTENKTISGIQQPTYTLETREKGTFTLVSMSDRDGKGVTSGTATVTVSNLNASFAGVNPACTPGAAPLEVNLSGASPWTLTYNDGDKDITVENIETTPYSIEAQTGVEYSLVSVQNAHCAITLDNKITFPVADKPTAAFVDRESCIGEQDMLSLSLTGTAPWTIRYTIDGVEKSFVANSQEATIPISQGGVYRMLAVDDSYCSGSVSESEQVIYEKPTAVLSGEAQSICGENGIAKLQITFTGSGPYNLTYSNGSQEQSLTTEQMNYELEVAEAGTYSLVSLTNDNCTGTVSGSVMIDNKADEMTAEILGPDNSCFGESIDLQLTYAPAEASVQLTTTGAGVLTEKQDNNFTYEPAEDESGAILFEAELTTECGTARFEKQVNISPELDADFTVEPDKIVTNSQATFKPVLESADAYSWEFGDGTRSDAQLTNNRYEESGIYTVTLSIEKDGCKSSGSKEIEVYLENVLYVPNAFSPLASNPESQVVKVYGENVSNDGFNFKIVNRWGKVMYETSSFDEANLEGWKGIHNGISEEMELNVFTYVLTGKFIEGESFEKTGTVTLIK